ncbi:MAG: phage/plasmid primase, P4 family, partial [Burkholderiales bacterium]
GKLRPGRREDLITRHAPVAFDPRARCPTWEAALHRWMAGDRALIAYLRRAVGYTLTGDTMLKTLFFLHGPTDGGKSTFVETLQALLGSDYGHKISAEVLMRKSFVTPNAASPHLMAVIGRRLIFA